MRFRWGTRRLSEEEKRAFMTLKFTTCPETAAESL